MRDEDGADRRLRVEPVDRDRPEDEIGRHDDRVGRAVHEVQLDAGLVVPVLQRLHVLEVATEHMHPLARRPDVQVIRVRQVLRAQALVHDRRHGEDQRAGRTEEEAHAREEALDVGDVLEHVRAHDDVPGAALEPADILEPPHVVAEVRAGEVHAAELDGLGARVDRLHEARAVGGQVVCAVAGAAAGVEHVAARDHRHDEVVDREVRDVAVVREEVRDALAVVDDALDRPAGAALGKRTGEAPACSRGAALEQREQPRRRRRGGDHGGSGGRRRDGGGRDGRRRDPCRILPERDPRVEVGRDLRLAPALVAARPHE